MVDEKAVEEVKEKSSQIDALQNQLGNVLSGVEKSLAVTCGTIMDKMKQLEEKIQDMDRRYSELVKDCEQAIKESERIEKKEEGQGQQQQQQQDKKD